MSARYLGMRAGDLDGKAYAKYWNPEVAPLPEHVREAIAHGPIAAPLLPRVGATATDEVENGYAIAHDGALHVALVTEMPDVTPAMIDWWFGWHSEEPQRYKLWHPRAHVHAAWRGPARAPASPRDAYVGRTSVVDEYLGSDLGRFAIRFVEPASIGLDAATFADPEAATAVCARVGFADAPADVGVLAHDVRRTHGGSVMRSRFWIGGAQARARAGGVVGDAVVGLVKLAKRPSAREGHALLVHCSQEMSHLATFLPRLFAEMRER